MAYVPTTFVDRSVEFPNRRKLTAVSGQADTFDVARAEGTVFVEGTKLDAANLNAEFGKIKTETDSIITSLNGFKFGVDDEGNYGYYKVGADSVTPFKTKPERLTILSGNISESLYGNQLSYSTLGYTKMDITGSSGFSVPVRGKGTYTQNTLNIDISNLTGFEIDNIKGNGLNIVLHD